MIHEIMKSPISKTISLLFESFAEFLWFSILYIEKKGEKVVEQLLISVLYRLKFLSARKNLVLSIFSKTITKTFKMFAQISRSVITSKGWFWYRRVPRIKLNNNAFQIFSTVHHLQEKSTWLKNLPTWANWLFKS